MRSRWIAPSALEAESVIGVGPCAAVASAESVSLAVVAPAAMTSGEGMTPAGRPLTPAVIGPSKAERVTVTSMSTDAPWTTVTDAALAISKPAVAGVPPSPPPATLPQLLPLHGSGSSPVQAPSARSVAVVAVVRSGRPRESKVKRDCIRGT